MWLLKRLSAFIHYSGIGYALALYKRGEVRRDGLTLVESSNQLDIEWRARDIHPWDRDRGCSSGKKRQLFNEQCFSDTEAAISRLFSALPLVDVIQFRVIQPSSKDVILAGRVARESLAEVKESSSPRGRLRQMGVNVCVIGFSLLLPLLGMATIRGPIPTRSPQYGGTGTTSSYIGPGLDCVSAGIA